MRGRFIAGGDYYQQKYSVGKEIQPKAIVANEGLAGSAWMLGKVFYLEFDMAC